MTYPEMQDAVIVRVKAPGRLLDENDSVANVIDPGEELALGPRQPREDPEDFTFELREHKLRPSPMPVSPRPASEASPTKSSHWPSRSPQQSLRL